MNETDLFEKLLEIDVDGLNITLEGDTLHKNLKKKKERPTIFIFSKKGSIKQETLKRIIWVANKYEGRVELKPYGVLEIKCL